MFGYRRFSSYGQLEDLNPEHSSKKGVAEATPFFIPFAEPDYRMRFTTVSSMLLDVLIAFVFAV